MAEDYHIRYYDQPDEAMYTAIGGGLRAYNIQQAGDHRFKHLCFVLYGLEGEIAGGLIVSFLTFTGHCMKILLESS